MGAAGFDPILQPRVLEVKALVESGKYTADIAIELGVQYPVLKRFLDSMGWPTKKKCQSEIQAAVWKKNKLKTIV